VPTENVTLAARRRVHFWVFWSIFLVAELPPEKRYFVSQEFTRFEIIPLSILGCDQQNLGQFLSNFEWSGHRSAHVFSDGWSTAPHKRKMTLLAKILSKRLCIRYCWRNMVCRRNRWSSWTGDRTQLWLRLQQEKVDLQLRIATVPEVQEEQRRNGVETETWKNSICDRYVACVDVRYFL